MLEAPAEPPAPPSLVRLSGGTSHAHVSPLKLPPAGHGLGAQLLQPAATRAAMTEPAESQRNPIFKASMRSGLAHLTSVAEILERVRAAP